jgi:hypothetical protein
MPGWLQNLAMVLGVTQKAHRNLRRSNRTVFDAEVDSGARQDAPAAHLPSHGSPALQQGRATTHVCARSRVLACAVRRLSLLRALYGEDEVPRVGHGGEVRPPPERSATFQSTQVAWDGRLISACLAILPVKSGPRAFCSTVGEHTAFPTV